MIKFFIRTLFCYLFICGHTLALAQTTAAILPQGKTQFLDNNGNPLSSGKVYFYIPSTTTFKTTWQDSAKTTPNTNPVILDAGGRAIIYGDGTYRQQVRTSANTLIYDAVTASAGTGGGGTTGTGDGDLVGTVKPWAGLVAPNQYVFAYGQEISRTTYAAFFTAVTLNQTLNCNSGSPILTNMSDTTQIPNGAVIETTCVAAGSTVISKTATTVTVSANASLTVATTAKFFLYGNGNGSTTFNVPDLRGRFVAGRDNMGGTAANRIAGATTGSAGGNQFSTITTPNLPAYTPTGSLSGILTQGNSGVLVTDPGHLHTLNNATNLINSAAGTSFGGGGVGATVSVTNNTAVTGITVAVNLANGGVFTGTAQGGTSTPLSIIPPVLGLNYIIKITPDQNSADASGVTSLGLMTGDIACGTGLLCTGNIISATSSTTNIFDTKALAQAATIVANVNLIILNGYTTAGDTYPAYYERVISACSSAWQFTSADGACWQYNNSRVNVKHFGAKGDSTTDDVTAITNALQAASTLNINWVDFPSTGSACYRINSVVNFPTDPVTSTLHIRGAVDDVARICPASTTQDAFNVGVPAVDIEGLTFQGLAAQTAGSYIVIGTSLVNNFFPKIHKNQFISMNNGIRIINGGPMWIEDNIFLHWQTAGIKSEQTLNPDADTGVFSNNYFFKNGAIYSASIGSCMSLSGPAGTRIMGNKCLGGQYGILLDANYTGAASSLIITSNSIEGQTDNNILIKNNASSGLSLFNLVIANNNIGINSNSGCSITLNTTGTFNWIQDYSISSNIILNVGTNPAGICVNGTTAGSISGNSFSNTTVSGNSAVVSAVSNVNLKYTGNSCFNYTGTNCVTDLGGTNIVIDSDIPGTNGQLLVGQTTAAPSWKTVSGDCTMALSGAITCTKTNGVTYPSSGTSGGIPYFSASNTIASSGVLASGLIVVGGGAGVAPTTFDPAPITNSLTGDVVLNNTGLYFTGPTVAQGSTGTWCASGTVTILDTAGAARFDAKLWDGTTVIASASQTQATVSFTTGISLSGCLASPAGNLRISVIDISSTSGLIKFNISGNSKDSTITAHRIK